MKLLTKLFAKKEFGSIKGKVINYYGQPIGDADVFAEINGEIISSSKADSKGDFLLENISTGTKNILVKAVKGSREAYHDDLTHRGSYGTGKGENNSVRITWRNPDVIGVQIPLIDVPKPKSPEFEIIILPKGEIEYGHLRQKFSRIKLKDTLVLPFSLKLEPFPDIFSSFYSLSVRFSAIKEKEIPFNTSMLNKMSCFARINGKRYDLIDTIFFPLEKFIDEIEVNVSGLQKEVPGCKKFKVLLDLTIFEKGSKRKYIKMNTAYYLVER